MTPKIFHFVWIGDESAEPTSIIDAWRARHPDWTVKVYRNAEALSGDWRFSAEIAEFHRRKRYPGAADLIRWEALLREGGIAVDADMLCFQTLPDWLLRCSLAACWDNTRPEGDLLINSFVMARPKDPVIGAVLDEIGREPIRYDRWSWSRMRRKPYGEWQTTGPVPFTRVVKRMRPTHFTALPSHFFHPRRRDGAVYDGGGPVFGEQLWGSTLGKAHQLKDLAEKLEAPHE